MSDEIDARKIALDERRLDFEIRRYEDEQGARELAKEKARVDLEKSREEISKIQEDIKSSRRPFYGNPSYLTPLATICVALLGGFVAFGTNWLNSDVLKLKHEKESLESTNGSLSNQQRQLLGEQSALRQDNHGLITTKTSLETENKKLLKEAGLLTASVDKAHTQITSLAKERDIYAKKLPSENAQAAAQILEENARVGLLSADDPSFKSLLSSAESFPENNEIRALIESVYRVQKPEQKSAAIAAATIIYIAYSDKSMKEVIERETIGQVKKQCEQNAKSDSLIDGLRRNMSWLKENRIFNDTDRGATLKDVYPICSDALKKQVYPIDRRNPVISFMATWDVGATIVFRDVWIDAWVNFLENDRSELSEQGAVTMAMLSIVRDGSDGQMLENKGVMRRMSAKCLPAWRVPICEAMRVVFDRPSADTDDDNDDNEMEITVPVEQRATYGKWVSDHEALMRLFLNDFVDESGDEVTPTEKRFKKLTNDQFRLIISGGWLADADVPM